MNAVEETPVAAQNRDPQGFVNALAARCERIETPCGDGSLVWRAWGQGEPLVLAHGAQGDWRHWMRNIERLSRHRRIYLVDLPGHGESALPESVDHRGFAKALAAGLDAIFGRAALPVDLCGFSLGGVVLAHLAAFYPHVARRLVIVGCGGLDTPHGHPDLGRVSGLRGEERRARLKANLLGLMLHADESADDLAIDTLLPMAKQARLEAGGNFVLPDKLLRILPDIRVPVDAIWGALDRPHPDPSVQEAALRTVQPDMAFRVIEGAGHWAMYERPQAFEAALLEVLDLPSRLVCAPR